MNIIRAKNITIVFFLLLNIFLFALNFVNRSQYTVSKEAETNIVDILQRNNVFLYASIVKDFSPVKQLSVLTDFYTEEEVLAFFMDENDAITSDVLFDKVTYRTLEKSLTFTNKNILFINSGQKVVLNPLNEDNARKLSDEFVKKMKTKDFNWVFDSYSSYEDSFDYEYRIRYDDLIFYSSYLKITVSSNGISMVRCSFMKPEGYSGVKKNIYSCDEALMAMMTEIKNIHGNIPVTVNRMDLVYFAEEIRQGNRVQVKSMPYYRFYISVQPEPILVDAYFNKAKRN